MAGEKKTTYKYEASMHSDATGHTGGAGHASADLRVTKTTTVDGQVVSTEVTEYTYDFAPEGNVFYSSGEVVFLARTTTDSGGPHVVMEGNMYFPITEEGFKAAKEWADSTVTRDGGKKRVPPGNPPNYKVLSYNCVDYTLELCKRAGVDVSEFATTGWPSTPSNLVAKMGDKQNKCTHEWEVKTININGPDGDVQPEKIRVCKLCGLTEPAGGD